MLRSVKAAHAGVGLRPDDEVERLEAKLVRRRRDSRIAPPVDEIRVISTHIASYPVAAR